MKRWLLTLAALCGGLLPTVASAHFLWLVQAVENGKPVVHAYFSEDAAADDPALLDRLADLVTHQASAGGEFTVLKLSKGDESLKSELPAGESRVVIGQCDLGVLNRGDAKFRLAYYAKGGPALDDPAWKTFDASKQLNLDVVPSLTADGRIAVQVTWKGQPAAKAEVTAVIPNKGNVKAEADEQGRAVFEKTEPGLYAVRARLIEPVKGELNGQAYDDVRHYSSVTFQIPAKDAVSAHSPIEASVSQLAALTPAVTSLGGAIIGDSLYIYGGNFDTAHSYSKGRQGHQLLKLNLDGSGKWEPVADGPGLQGLALVAHGRRLYRVGGFTAKNEAGAKHDLWSQDAVVAYDLDRAAWVDLPSLPEPRSSHDAAVLGDTLYVVGGWALQGNDQRTWHKTAWAMDLSAEKPEWQSLPEPPFERRAQALAAHDGKLYAIGGMQKEDGPCTLVSIYDPQTKKWSEGPSIQGEPMAGFGSSAFATGGALYVSSHDGQLQRLSADGSAWNLVMELPRARFFHRMLPLDDHRFVLVGGASMEVGKFEEVDVVSVP